MKKVSGPDFEEVEKMARESVESGEINAKRCEELLEKLEAFRGNLRCPRTVSGTAMILGAYAQGGSHGLTVLTRRLPWLTTFLNKYLQGRLRATLPHQEQRWTSLALHRTTEANLHRDVHNKKGSCNYVLEIGRDKNSGLWVEGNHEQHPVHGGGEERAKEYEKPDGEVLQGRLVDLSQGPVVFNPRTKHALVKDTGVKWILSGYTPSGVQALARGDVEGLRRLQFPVQGIGLLEDMYDCPSQHGHYDTAGETTPWLKAFSPPPQFATSSRAQVARDEEEGSGVVPEDVMHVGDWEIYVPESGEEEEVDRTDDEIVLRQVCSGENPGNFADYLRATYEGIIGQEILDSDLQDDMGMMVEEWCREEEVLPRVAKLEPEYTKGIEELIASLEEPLRHTHNVDPAEVRKSPTNWLPSIRKELGVVEKGFKRISSEEVKVYAKMPNVQFLPAKMVYTLKPPGGDGDSLVGEARLCKRKARIVCCGNFAEDNQEDVFASGAAAESLRCTLTNAAAKRWSTGGLDITGAFMLTPTPTGPEETIYIVTPRAVLVQLGVVQPGEKWLLTHGMYGLRQSPRLWAGFRDRTMKEMVTTLGDTSWKFVQGKAEPNIWFIYEAGSSISDPQGTILVYVDDIDMCPLDPSQCRGSYFQYYLEDLRPRNCHAPEGDPVLGM